MKKTILFERVARLAAAQETAASSLTDEQAIDCIALYKPWQPDTAYVADQRIRYADRLYRCVQAHTSQTDWTPDVTPALWTEIAKPGEIPVWRQPTGAQDAYNTGDKVHYPDANGPVYESLVNANVWAPDVYGWQLVNE